MFHHRNSPVLFDIYALVLMNRQALKFIRLRTNEVKKKVHRQISHFRRYKYVSKYNATVIRRVLNRNINILRLLISLSNSKGVMTTQLLRK